MTVQKSHMSSGVLFGQESDSKEEADFKIEALHTLDKLFKALEQWETQQLLGGQYDKLGATLSIQVVPHVFQHPTACIFRFGRDSAFMLDMPAWFWPLS